jgi:hypothetical protein
MICRSVTVARDENWFEIDPASVDPDQHLLPRVYGQEDQLLRQVPLASVRSIPPLKTFTCFGAKIFSLFGASK